MFFANLLKLTPALDEIILFAKFRIILVEFGFENVCVWKCLTSIIERREDAKCCVLYVSFNRQKDAVVQETAWQIREVSRIICHKLINFALEEAEVLCIAALHFFVDNAVFKNSQKLFLILICSYLWVDFQKIHIWLVKLVCLPDTFAYHLTKQLALLILHLLKTRIKSTKQEHDGR